MQTLDRYTRHLATPDPAATPGSSDGRAAAPPPPPDAAPGAEAFDEPVFLPLPSPRPPQSSPPAPPRAARRSGAVVLAAAVGLAALVGGAAGYFAGNVADDGSTAAAGSPSAAGAIDAAAVAAAVEPSVVTITTEVTVRQGPRQTTASSAGTGIVLTADGQVLTNAHVVAGTSTVTVVLAGETAGHPATVLGADAANDIALLQVQGVSGLTPATIGDSDTVVVGEGVLAIGNALDLDGAMSVTSGIISALNRTVQVDGAEIRGMLQTDTAISSGNSGGPLVNAAGEVIGVVTAGATSSRTVTAENIGFAVTINRAMEIVAGWR